MRAWNRLRKNNKSLCVNKINNFHIINQYQQKKNKRKNLYLIKNLRSKFKQLKINYIKIKIFINQTFNLNVKIKSQMMNLIFKLKVDKININNFQFQVLIYITII